ncbi:MAG: hypothetical protein WDN24_13570 [Sphingomonas sp.]
MGVNTFNAIRQLQAQHGIAVDGQCSGATLTKVRDLGYAAVEFLVGDGNEGLNWPKKPGPAALAQPNATLTSSMFGEFEFEAAPTPDNPEAIRIKGGWESDNIVTVDDPPARRGPDPDLRRACHALERQDPLPQAGQGQVPQGVRRLGRRRARQPHPHLRRIVQRQADARHADPGEGQSLQPQLGARRSTSTPT